jgi:hypothetical protein
MKIALVHEWLDSYAGSERVLEQLLMEWPEADVFAVCDFMPQASHHQLHPTHALCPKAFPQIPGPDAAGHRTA